jgi:hypothetical protein
MTMMGMKMAMTAGVPFGRLSGGEPLVADVQRLLGVPPQIGRICWPTAKGIRRRALAWEKGERERGRRVRRTYGACVGTERRRTPWRRRRAAGSGAGWPGAGARIRSRTAGATARRQRLPPPPQTEVSASK